MEKTSKQEKLIIQRAATSPTSFLIKFRGFFQKSALEVSSF